MGTRMQVLSNHTPPYTSVDDVHLHEAHKPNLVGIKLINKQRHELKTYTDSFVADEFPPCF